MSRGSRPRVYLAGPITGLNYTGATDWRDDVTEELLPYVLGISPLRGVPHGASVDFNTGPHTGAKESTARDRWDVRTCDAVLMNVLGATRVSIGSMIEAGWADAFRVPLVLVMDEKNIHRHSMLEQCAGWVVPTLTEGIDQIKFLFWRP